MTYLIIALIAAILFALIFLGEVSRQDQQIKQLKREWEESLNTVNYYRRMVDGFREKMKEEEEKYEILSAAYCTSDSDLMKYNSEKCMRNVIRNKLAMTLSKDIIKRFDMRILPLGDGKEKYSLTIKVKKI